MASYSPGLQRIYGATAAAVEANLVPVVLDWPKGDGKSAQRVVVRCNKHVMAARLSNVNRDINAYCDAHPGTGYTIHPPVGCFNWRRIVGGISLSMHSGAIAIDLNPAENPLGFRLVTNIPSWMVAIFIANGFVWGGRWVRKDAMHWELGVHTEPGVVRGDWWLVSFRTKRTGNAGLVDKYARYTLGDRTLMQSRPDGSVAFLAHSSGKAAIKLAAYAALKGIVCKVQRTSLTNSDADMRRVIATE